MATTLSSLCSSTKKTLQAAAYRTCNISILAYQRPSFKFYSSKTGDWHRQCQSRVAYQPDPVTVSQKKEWPALTKTCATATTAKTARHHEGQYAQHMRLSKIMVESFGSFSTLSFCKNFSPLLKFGIFCYNDKNERHSLDNAT